jgi:two-component system chemotaxis sensor kinase CheA
MMFHVREKLYAVPIDHVVEIRRSKESEIVRAGNREVIQLRDELLTVVRLRRMEGEETIVPDGKVFLAVVTMGSRKIALAVDALVGEQELVIKPLDEKVVASDLVSGASVLGDGTVALILNLGQVVRRYGMAAPLVPSPASTTNWGATA